MSLDTPDQHRLLAASRFLQRVAARHADDWQAGAFALAPDVHAQTRTLAGIAQDDDLARQMRALRSFREREMARIAVRDLAGLAPLDETLQALSALAEGCLQSAFDASLRELETRFGTPRSADGGALQAAVLGMGKLGGQELNFSSDIDLIFIHGGEGESDGPRRIAAETFFTRLVHGIQRRLSEPTADGIVFRVDLLLRPFGSVGALSVTPQAAERYYRTHGREWERYAMVKARPVAGDLALGHRLVDALQPFVYRPYLDFNALLALRALKRMIEDDAERRGVGVGDVKLGRGGIREVEFIVQSFQLVRGGQVPQLRDARLRPVLRWLGDSGLLERDVAGSLDDAYVFLRRLENAIQMYEDRQTHRLPEDAQAREALCAALRYDGWPALLRAFEAITQRVHDAFAEVFSDRPGRRPGEAALDWDPEAGRDTLIDVFREAGFSTRPEAIADALLALRRSRPRSTLSDDSVARLRRLLRQLLSLCLHETESDEAAERVLGVLHAIAGRSTYLTLLHENAQARVQLVRLCAASGWISRQIASTPQVLDQLLDAQSLYMPPSREQMQAELAARLAALDVDDVEAGMDALRRFRQETTLRIAASDVTGGLSLVQVSDHLTWLAESVVQAALRGASDGVRAVHGLALRRDDSPAGFVCVAYGKFGGIELGYGSDLDLVFIHDCDAPDRETTGRKPLAAGALLTRIGQRLIHWLSTLTPAGRAYEVDVELRPSGRSGLPVVNYDGFARYQREQAWTWEHQALTRARFVAGDAALGARFEALRRELLCAPRDARRLRADVLDMRARMAAKLDKSNGEWDVKQGEGGLIDIEFMTQYLLLREAAAHPDIVACTDNWRQLEALVDAGVLQSSQADTLLAIYRSYRAWSHARSLQDRAVRAPTAQFAAERAEVSRQWEACFGQPRAALREARA